ncbi:hypothetical protein Btru_035991 [Bulinus truncatus]|nr:hypothetical protein Btru_035991 [Bulinus truncatus]
MSSHHRGEIDLSLTGSQLSVLSSRSRQSLSGNNQSKRANSMVDIRQKKLVGLNFGQVLFVGYNYSCYAHPLPIPTPDGFKASTTYRLHSVLLDVIKQFGAFTVKPKTKMAMTPILLLLFTLVALSTSCCTPDQWEGIESSIGGWAARKRSGLLKEYVKVSYDFTNKRTAAFVDYSNGEYANRFKIVVRYDGEVGNVYVVDLKKDKCWTKKLNRPFRQACIPDSAKPVGDYYLGLDGGFKLSGYAIEGPRVSAFVSVQNISNGQCVPVTEAVYGKLTKADFVQTVGFVNVTPGIKNATVFDVPAECEKKQDTSLAEGLTRDHFILAL